MKDARLRTFPADPAPHRRTLTDFGKLILEDTEKEGR
jgi:hypothetical protein